MKDVLDEFKEDLDFLIQTREHRSAEPSKRTQQMEVHDYPDLLHIQSYLFRAGAEKENVRETNAFEQQEEEISILPREEPATPDLNSVWEDFVLAEEPAAAVTTTSQEETTLTLEQKEPETEPIPSAPGFEDRTPQLEPADQPVERPEETTPVSEPVEAAPPLTEPPVEEPEREPIHYIPKKRETTPIWKKLWASMQGHAFIGVDVGTQSLKLVSLHKGAAGFSLAGFSNTPFEPIPEELPEAERFEMRQAQILAMLKGKFRHLDYITSALTGLEVIYRQLTLPKISKKELAEAVPWAVRKDLPYDIENASLGFEIQKTVKERRAEKLKVGTVVAPAQLVAEHLQIYQKLGVLPAKLTAVPVAIWNVVHRDKALQNQRVLVIEIGARRTHLVFVNQGVLDFHREITTAARDFIEGISNSMFYDLDRPQLTLEEAVQIWERHGIPDKDSDHKVANGVKLAELNISLRPVLERLVNEIRRSIDYYREKFKVDGIDRVFISGGGACVPNLQAWLAKMLNEAVEPLNPFQMAGIKKWEHFSELAANAPRFTVAVGLALDLSGGMNLLPVELQGMHRLHKIKKALRYLALTVVVGLGLSTAFLTLKMQQITAELSHLQTRYIKMEPVRQEFMRLKAQQDQLQQKLNLYKSKIFVNPNAVHHLRAISNLVPRSIALTSLTIAPLEVREEEDSEPKKTGVEKIVLRGIAFPARALEGSNLAEFLLKLKNSGYFQSIEMVGQETQANGAIAFVINCYY